MSRPLVYSQPSAYLTVCIPEQFSRLKADSQTEIRNHSCQIHLEQDVLALEIPARYKCQFIQILQRWIRSLSEVRTL